MKMSLINRQYKQGRRVFSLVLFFILTLFFIFLLSSCTDYERAGINPRPFNEPARWELNPYGDAFHN